MIRAVLFDKDGTLLDFASVAYIVFRRHVYLNYSMRNKESMQQKKRSYGDERKSEAVKMVNEQGLSQQEAGRRMSIPKGTIASWVAAAKSGTGRSRPGDPSVAELAAENQRLRKELNEACMERKILKKADALGAVTEVHLRREKM